MSTSPYVFGAPASTGSALPAAWAAQPSMVAPQGENHGSQRWDSKASRFKFPWHCGTAAIGRPELAAACTVFPHVVLRALEGGWSLLAITGLLPGHKLFGDDQGDWEAGCVPAPKGDALFDEASVQVPWCRNSP